MSGDTHADSTAGVVIVGCAMKYRYWHARSAGVD